MYGIFHVEIQHYIETRYSRDVWTAALKRAGLKNRIYMTVSTYLDSEIKSLMKATSEITGVSVEALFVDFGAFTIPSLMSMYEPLINPKWTMMDLLLNLESAIYRVIRARSPGAQPPRMGFERAGPYQLRLHYNSPRRMPALAKGFVIGVAAYYGEMVDIKTENNPDGSVDMLITIMRD